MFNMSVHHGSHNDEAYHLAGKALADMMKKKSKGHLTQGEVKSVVGHYRSVPLSEFEKDLEITQTNDVRSRKGYSKSPLYAMVSDKARARRRKQVEKLLGRSQQRTDAAT